MYAAVYPSKKHKQRCTHVHEIKHNMRRDRDILDVLLSSLLCGALHDDFSKSQQDFLYQVFQGVPSS